MSMNEKREKTRFLGVYQRRSTIRRNHRDGKSDACFYITYKDQSGKKVWEKVGWKSEGFTAQFANSLRADRMQVLRHGEPIKPEPDQADVLTFGRAWDIFAEKWLPTLARPTDEKSRYEKHLAPVWADMPLDRISTMALEGFKQDLLVKPLSPATVKLILGDIRRVYHKMRDWGLYEGKIPTDALKMPKVDNARLRYLTTDEAAALLDALELRSRTWWRIAAISLYTGMRLGEVLALKKPDIDLEAGVIQVLAGKTGTRMAHMTEDLKPLLAALMAESTGELLFRTGDGRPMKTHDSSNTFARTVKDLGLNKGLDDSRQKAVFHTLRHTFCSWLAIRGVPLYTIAELVGHSTLEMTKRYSHLCPDAKKEAIGRLNSLTALGGPPANGQ